MEREGTKDKARRKKKQEEEEQLWVELKRGVLVGKKGGNFTPSPKWRYGLAQIDGSLLQDSTFPYNSTSLSVRKLGSNFWEIQQFDLRIKMSKAGPMPYYPKDKGFQLQSPPEQADDLRRHLAALKKQHNQSVAENGDAVQCESPAGCSSSLEMAPYRPVVIPPKMNIKGRNGNSSYSLKTSTELLQVLNRIWSLEEQHESHVLLVKALKRELDDSKIRIKELQREKTINRRGTNELMKHIAGDSQIGEAVRTLRDELEDERKMKKHSEYLKGKLGKELLEVKSSFLNTLRELEGERKARVMLEHLCDEFAKEIKGYEHDVRALKCKSGIFGEQNDKLILHISEAWLDERMQTKMKGVGSSDHADDKETISGRLGFEIEEFLRAKKAENSRSDVALLKQENKIAPRNKNVEGEPSNGRLHKQEDRYTSRVHLEQITKSNPMIKKCQSERMPELPALFSPKMQYEDKIHEEKIMRKEITGQTDSKDLEKTKVLHKRKSKQLRGRSSLLNGLIRHHTLSRGRETGEKHTELHFDPSTFTGPAEFAQCSKENTLKAMLLEARLERQ